MTCEEFLFLVMDLPTIKIDTCVSQSMYTSISRVEMSYILIFSNTRTDESFFIVMVNVITYLSLLLDLSQVEYRTEGRIEVAETSISVVEVVIFRSDYNTSRHHHNCVYIFDLGVGPVNTPHCVLKGKIENTPLCSCLTIRDNLFAIVTSIYNLPVLPDVTLGITLYSSRPTSVKAMVRTLGFTV